MSSPPSAPRTPPAAAATPHPGPAAAGDAPPRGPLHGRRQLSRVLDRNMRALLQHRAEEERRKGLEERAADAIARFTGSMRFVYLHVLLFGGWILVNTGAIPGVPRFDPSFVMLAMFASVEAIFLSTFVLINQNRMAALADERADLDVHVSLLAEHEIARLIRLTTAVAARLGVEDARDPELDELARDVRPEVVLARLQQHTEAVERETGTQIGGE